MTQPILTIPNSESTKPAPLLGNLQTVCALLAMSRSSVQRLRNAGQFPLATVNRGHLVLFNLADVKNFSQTGTV